MHSLRGDRPPPVTCGRRSLLLFVLLLGAGFVLSGCQEQAPTQPELSLEHEIAPRPPKVGPAALTLRLTDAAGKPISGARLDVEANMSHAGMSPVFGTARETEPGRYESALEFTMAGDWIILVHITLPGGGKLEKQFDVKGVQPG